MSEIRKVDNFTSTIGDSIKNESRDLYFFQAFSFEERSDFNLTMLKLDLNKSNRFVGALFFKNKCM